MLQSGRMNQVLDQVVVCMQCSSQAGWVKFMNRKLYSCHAPVRQDESNPWPGSCIHVMLQSDRMSQVLEQEVVFMSCSSQAGWVKFMNRKLYSCYAPVRQDESSSWPGMLILDWWPWHCVQMVNRVKIFIIYLTDSTFKYFIFHDYIAGKKWLNLILADFNLYLF
jgi:hypothetical protein